MKQLTLTVPNSINDSLNAIETLRFHGTLTELACRLLEMLYIAGWEDGFVALDRPNISRALGASPEEVSALLRELEELHLACARTGGVSK